MLPTPHNFSYSFPPEYLVISCISQWNCAGKYTLNWINSFINSFWTTRNSFWTTILKSEYVIMSFLCYSNTINKILSIFTKVKILFCTKQDWDCQDHISMSISPWSSHLKGQFQKRKKKVFLYSEFHGFFSHNKK